MRRVCLMLALFIVAVGSSGMVDKSGVADAVEATIPTSTTPPASSDEVIELDPFEVTDVWAEDEHQLVFVTNRKPETMAKYPPRRWLRIPLGHLIGTRTQIVTVAGRLTATSSGPTGGWMKVNFREVGSEKPCERSYQWYINLTSAAADGDRDQPSQRLRVIDDAVEVCWAFNNTGATYTFNLRLDGPVE